MSAASYIPIAKLLDVWGRAEGFALLVGSATLGLILMSSAGSLSVFCAAQVCTIEIFIFILGVLI